jgi:hypothetical protein
MGQAAPSPGAADQPAGEEDQADQGGEGAQADAAGEVDEKVPPVPGWPGEQPEPDQVLWPRRL